MAAIVLRRLGHNVRVLEQTSEKNLEEKGAGITVGSSAKEFFAKHDLTKEDYFVFCPGVQYLNSDSKVTRTMKRPLLMSTWSTLFYRLLANLNGTKSEFCPSPPDLPMQQGVCSVEMGVKVIDVSYANGQVTIDYRNTLKSTNGSIQSDLVISADGASSIVRQILLPNINRTYAGYVAWRGFVIERDVSQKSREILDPECNAFAYSGGYILW